MEGSKESSRGKPDFHFVEKHPEPDGKGQTKGTVQFRWSAGHSMDVLDASEGGQEKASAAYQIRAHFGCSYL